MNPVIYAELADTPATRELGLMHREKIPRHGGMLFRFPHAFRLSFWMKDTKIPLDIAYVDDDMTIREIRSLVPMSTRSVQAGFPCKIALEVNAGWFEEHGIVPGSKLRLAQVQPELGAVPEGIQPPEETPEEQPQQPMRPDLQVNLSLRDAVDYANQYKLAIAFDYLFADKGNINSYIMYPLEPYNVIPGDGGQLLQGPCVHSDGEFRNFKINNILHFDLIETEGPNAGRPVQIPAPGTEASGVTACSEPPRTALAASYATLVKEAQGYSTGQLMMTEYWDEIKSKRQKGKTEGQAILEYLEENSRRNAPKKSKKKKKKKPKKD